jgi:DNA-binding protein HU-beta
MDVSRKLADAIAAKEGISKKEAGKLGVTVLSAIEDIVKAEGRLTIVGFGSFRMKHRAARVGRNPQTGGSITIPAKDVLVFKAAK